MVVVQVTLLAEKISSGTAIVTLIQSLAGALFNFVAQSVFETRLLRALADEAPSLDTARIMEPGATMIRHLVEPDMLPAVLRAYSTAVMRAFIVAAALAAGSVLGVQT